MYLAKLEIINVEDKKSQIVDLGVYSRPSTVERLRRQLADRNPKLSFILNLIAYDPRNKTESS